MLMLWYPFIIYVCLRESLILERFWVEIKKKIRAFVLLLLLCRSFLFRYLNFSILLCFVSSWWLFCLCLFIHHMHIMHHTCDDEWRNEMRMEPVCVKRIVNGYRQKLDRRDAYNYLFLACEFSPEPFWPMQYFFFTEFVSSFYAPKKHCRQVNFSICRL